jgi:tRNA-uridine 2-sulfurtransferase
MARGTEFADHLRAPRGAGRLRGWPHAGAAGGAACGDLVRFAVRVEGDRVAEAGFSASGCGATTAAASAAVELVEGASFLAAAGVKADDIADALGGLVPSKRHAAELAADALHRALGAAAREGAPLLASSERRTLVAMSGGVDSAVAAKLALDAGDEVVAVTLELWADAAQDGTKSCCSPQAVADARALAHRMGLPHVTLDLREPFRREVVDDFLAEYGAGRTPNPCVRCNGLVRFDALLRLAERLGAARLATGHYARIERDVSGPLLRTAADAGKDQTYMLARLRPEQLEQLWFPLGELEKPKVRAIAREAGLPAAEKPESQDLCFIAGLRRSDFLARHSRPSAPGDIVDLRGRVVGRHEGQQAFTVGQRRGIGVAAAEPLYVLHKDARANRIVVGPRDALATRSVTVEAASLLRPGSEVDRVKLRYRSKPVPCRLEDGPPAGRHERLVLTLEDPVDGAAPGQTACLMRGDAVLGWATIAGTRMEALDVA